jgi:hypothetical protein
MGQLDKRHPCVLATLIGQIVQFKTDCREKSQTMARLDRNQPRSGVVLPSVTAADESR